MTLAGIPFWGDPNDLGNDDLTELYPDPWATLRFGGRRLPGLSRVTGPRRRDLDSEKPKGAKGAHTVDNGEPLVEFDVEHSMWTAKQWAGFLDIMSLLQPNQPNAALPPVKAENPAIQFVGVTTVVLEEINPPDIDGGTGTVKLKLRQWVPKPKPIAKPKAKDAAKADPKKKLVGWENDYDARQAEAARNPEATIRNSRWSDPATSTGWHATDKPR